MAKRCTITTFALLLVVLFAHAVLAFTQDGCGSGECSDCHEMNKKEAATLLSITEDRIVELKFAEVPGLWEVDVLQQGKVLPLFVDFSKQYLISGTVIKIADKQDITRERFTALNRIDVAQIPLDDALVVGDPNAKNKIIVFDDPECPYCKKLQDEMHKVISSRPDIAFFIKMFPLKSHPKAYDKAKAIVCKKSLAMLEDSLNGKELPAPTCETDQVDKSIELGQRIGVRSTPTLIHPDGRIIPGYKPADKIIELLETAAP